MSISAFTPSAYGMAVGISGLSQAYALPGGTDTTLLITNIGPAPAAVLLGASSSVAVTASTGIVVLPNQQIALAVGANTHLAAMGLGGAAQLNLARGV